MAAATDDDAQDWGDEDDGGASASDDESATDDQSGRWRAVCNSDELGCTFTSDWCDSADAASYYGDQHMQQAGTGHACRVEAG